MKPIPGFSGRYMATHDGHIYSSSSKKQLKGRPNHNGYLRVHLRDDDGRTRNWMIHRLVLMAYHGPECGLECNHKDGKKDNNSLYNLEWVTHKQNMAHASQKGLLEPQARRMAEMNVERCSVPIKALDTDGRESMFFHSLREAERRGFQHSEISRCLAGKAKTHRGYFWSKA